MRAASQDQVLPTTVLRGIGDKLYDKRKSAALEVEQLVKQHAAQGNNDRIGTIVNKLVKDYAFSAQANHRKGGLLCLAAAAVALAEQNQEYLGKVVPPVLSSLVDQDARVRYYACEALYNIAKVARDDFMPHFPDTFDALFRLCADNDSAVHQATTFLDNLMKDIATASTSFDMAGFVPQLREYLTVLDSKKRMFLISWVTVLASVPDIDMLAHLPELLAGLLDALQDDLREVRTAASKALQEFLIEIQVSQHVDCSALAAILVGRAREGDEVTRLVAMRWLREFVGQAKEQLLQHYAPILAAVLPGLSHNNSEVAAVARATNRQLLDLPASWQERDTEAVLAVVSDELGSEQEQTRLDALHWINALLAQDRTTVLKRMDLLLPALLDALTAPSERVAVESLAVQASIAADEEHFRPLIQQLLNRFRGRSGAGLLQRRGSLIVRRLARLLGPRQVLCALAAALEGEQDLRFACALVQALNLILLTAPELNNLRTLLKQAAANSDGAALRACLYKSWCHSAGAVLSLCLLSQAYGHASELVAAFADVPMTLEVLVQVDRLVQLLETPVFTFLRLQLLQPARYPALIRTCYGILMLLPQSHAFKTLHARLHSVPTQALLQLDTLSPKDGGPSLQDSPPGSQDLRPLLDLFRKQQEAHAADEERRRYDNDALGAEPGDGDLLRNLSGIDVETANGRARAESL
ncbi:hypothetical protein WJX73_005859 [Symbiochloris irregularis]|uniref:Vacuolar protein 14 C-terminal Fig4-binding domain-containing protein n=1 Tax=Symbiochloris irregularis TaxID=706552 RepID=A0AAW1PCT7_9CHLO